MGTQMLLRNTELVRNIMQALNQLVEACIWHYNISVGLDNVIGHGVVSDYTIAYDNGTTRVWKAST